MTLAFPTNPAGIFMWSLPGFRFGYFESMNRIGRRVSYTTCNDQSKFKEKFISSRLIAGTGSATDWRCLKLPVKYWKQFGAVRKNSYGGHTCFLHMPDHLHALLSFPPAGKRVQLIVSKWKEWVAKEVGVIWQRDFFEHRLRHDESRHQKADYILQNPVRKQLVSRPEQWPFVCFADGQRPNFDL